MLTKTLAVFATLALSLTFVGCGAPPDTICGQRLDDSLSDWLTVADLQAAEDAFVSAALLVAGDERLSTPGEACKWLKGTLVVAMPAPTWVDEWGRRVAGLATPATDWSLSYHAPGGHVQVGRQADGRWQSSALVHEWIHIVQGTVPAPPCAPWEGAHCGWGRPGGEYALIDALSR